MKTKLLLSVFLLAIVTNKIIGQSNHLSTSDLIVNSTIRIVSFKDTLVNGRQIRITSTGTGFYFEFSIDSLKVPVIVTNYHVIKGFNNGVLNFTERVNNSPSYGHLITERFYDFQKMWIKDPGVDLAILPLNPIIEKIKQTKHKVPFIIYYTENLLPSKKLLGEVTAIEDVFMVGYPVGLWDEKNNLPIVRKGITATPIYIDYDGKKQFLIDIPDFPGSSGSPVILFDRGTYSTRLGGTVVGKRMSLLGINVQTVDYGAEGSLRLPPNNPTIRTSTRIPINIGVVIKSERLLDFKPILKEIIDNFKRK